MNNRELNTIVETYLAAWNEPDEVMRRALLEEIWAANGRYTDPNVDATNLEELNQAISGFHNSMPGSRFALEGEIDHHHDVVRFKWLLQTADGGEIPGLDVGELAGGRLTRIIGFFSR